MPTNIGQASNEQLQRYLEQLYSKAPFYQQLISPANTKSMLIQAAAKRDSTPPVGTVGNPRNTQSTQNSDALRKALEGSWKAQGNAPYTSPTLPTSTTTMRPIEQSTNYKLWQARNNANATAPLSNAIPNMVLNQQTPRPTQIGTPNQAIMRLEAERDRLDKLHAKPSASLGLTSYDLDPNLAGQGPNGTLAQLEAEIRALAGQPDIPGQWISPYSQEYLNQLGNRLGQAGSDAQQQFQGAIGDVVANYGQADATRNQYNTALAGELAANGQNIGIQTGASTQGQQAATDANYLNQVSAANQATDTSFMTKLGEMAQFYGGNLGAQAREGLLTPKQWIGPQSGIDAGEQALLDFLGNKYNTEIGREDAATDFMRQVQLAKMKAAGSDSSSGGATGIPKIAMTADETQLMQNPDFVAAFGELPEGTTKDLIRQYYNAGDDTSSALTKAQNAATEAINAGPTGFPLGRTGIVPRGASTPTGGGLDLNYAYGEAQKVQSEQWKKILEFLTKYDPKWNAVTTKQELGTKSTTNYNG